MPALGLDLSESASQALQIGVVHALPYLALILIVGATGFIQQRQIQGRNTGASVNPQQQMIMKIMPIFLPVISFGLPSGLVIYFAVSNLYRIGQQAFITRSIYGMKGGKRPEGAEPVEATPQPSFREMFGLAKKNASNAAENKAAAKKKVPAKSGAPARASVKTSPKGSTKTASKAGSKAGSKTASKTAAKTAPGKTSSTTSSTSSSDKGSPSTSSRSSRSTPKSSPTTSGTGGSNPPTLQPRARKNKKG